MTKRTFIYGAAILLGANLLNRLLGFAYQYLIMSKIGGEAYGLFNMVFPVYMMALVITTAGIPVAVSKMVSEEISLGRSHQAAAIFRVALIVLTLSGAFVAIMLYIVSPHLADKIFPDPRVLKVFMICTPAILVVSVASAFRGYFQGLQNMIPTALSQISEQIIRVSLGFFTAFYYLPRGVEWAAAGLSFGMLAGEIVGLLVILLQYYLNKNKLPSLDKSKAQPYIHTLKRLWQISTPITIGRLLATGSSALDAILIPQRLQVAGYTAREATTLFGQLGGSAFTLLTFPSVFTFALATSLVPAISEAATQNKYYLVRSRSTEAIRLTIILGLPCLIILFYFAQPLTAFFRSENIAPVLRILTIGGIFAYLHQTTTGILQGLGKVHLPVINSLLATTVRIPLIFTLTALPQWGLIGSAWAYVIGFFIMASLNTASIIRHTGMPLDFVHFILQPFTAGLGMLFSFKLLSPSISSHLINYFEEILLASFVYAIILFLNGGLTLSDIRRIPWLGNKLPPHLKR